MHQRGPTTGPDFIPKRSMTQKRQSPFSRPDEPGLNISSLIDVCFLLLIYFLVTTQIIQKEQELSSTLPRPFEPLTALPDLPPLVIQITAEGTISLRNESGLVEVLESDPQDHDLPQLSKRLALHRNVSLVSGKPALVTIHVDGDAKQQRVTDVLNALTEAGLREITFHDWEDHKR